MLIITLFRQNDQDHYVVQALDESKDDVELVDVTTEYQALPMRLTDPDSGEQVDGFFFGRSVGDVEDADPTVDEGIEKLPRTNDVDWEE